MARRWVVERVVMSIPSSIISARSVTLVEGGCGIGWGEEEGDKCVAEYCLRWRSNGAGGGGRVSVSSSMLRRFILGPTSLAERDLLVVVVALPYGLRSRSIEGVGLDDGLGV